MTATKNRFTFLKVCATGFLGVASVVLLSLSIAGYVLASWLFPPHGYRIDARRVRWHNYVVADADPETFERLQDDLGMDLPWGRDARYGYFREHRVEDSHGPSFVAIDSRTAKDRNCVYRGERLVKQLHPEVAIISWRSAQAGTVWKIRGVDARTFRRDERGYVDAHNKYVPTTGRSFNVEARPRNQVGRFFSSAPAEPPTIAK